MLLPILLSSILSPLSATPLTYPEARKADTVYDYAGTKVGDPYSWLEEMDSPETKAWVDAEKNLTASYLDAIPERARIASRVKELISYEKYGLPEKEGSRYFFSRNSGLQNQSILYVADSLNGTPRVLLDPNTLSNDGTIALSGQAISDDGKLMAYSLSSGGSDWQEWHVRDVNTGKDLPDVIKWSKFSGASWTKDDKGFFYSRYDEPKGNIMKEADYFQKLYYHRLGTVQSQDPLIYERPDQKEWGFQGDVSEDGRYLVITVWEGTAHQNRIFYSDLRDWKPETANGKRLNVTELLPKGDAEYGYLSNVGSNFYFKTDKDHPRGEMVSIDVRNPERGFRVVVPEAEETLQSATDAGNRIFCNYMKDAHTLERVYTLDGKHVGDVSLPGIGSASGFNGKLKDREAFYQYASYTSPATVYRYDIASGKSTVFRKPKVAFDGSKYETKEVFFQSKDGTRVPMFITAKKGLVLNGENPTLMYGYGGFSIPETPGYSTSRAVWLEMGGVYADVVLRGGSEYGEEWHKAGMLHNKQNVFDDFISAAEWLIANHYTSTPKLAIQGASNGGLLIGAMLTQRPDLWGATLPEVGVMDMLRFNKFTIGHAWMTEYGNPDTAEDFPYIYKYSPLHNLKPGTHYPPTLISTADHDDRVFPAHSFKFAATMQAAQAGDAPVLIRIETRAGHGAGKPLSKQISEIADDWAFLVKNLNMTLPF